MVDRGAPPNVITYTAIINAHCVSGELSASLGHLAQVIKNVGS